MIKPAIGAGSRDTARYGPSDKARALQHLERLVGAGRSTILQSYLDKVDEAGETALIYFGGQFSHSIHKGPRLRPSAGLVEGLFALEDIRPREADGDERRVAAAAVAALPFEALLYARVDLIRDREGMPVLLELELTEPSLNLVLAMGAATELSTTFIEYSGR